MITFIVIFTFIISIFWTFKRNSGNFQLICDKLFTSKNSNLEMTYNCYAASIIIHSDGIKHAVTIFREVHVQSEFLLKLTPSGTYYLITEMISFMHHLIVCTMNLWVPLTSLHLQVQSLRAYHGGQECGYHSRARSHFQA